MDGKSPNRRDWLIGEIADRQHGVVARRQLLAAGLSADVIDGSLAAGRLRPLFRGVYAVGHAVVSPDGWCQAALLACGEESVLGHHTACMKWSLRQRRSLPPLGDRPRRPRPQARPHRDAAHKARPQGLGGVRRPACHHPSAHDRRHGRRVAPETDAPARRARAGPAPLRPRADRAGPRTQPTPPGLPPTAPPHCPPRSRRRRCEVLPGAPVPCAWSGRHGSRSPK